MDICKTKVKLLEEVEHGCKDIDNIKGDDLIDLAIFFIEEYKMKSPVHKVIKDFLRFKDENYCMKIEMARSVITENYDFIDDLFDEVYAAHLYELEGYSYYYTEL